MITLKTLPQATAQEVFDQVKNHLLSQKAQSKMDDMCLYRNPNGLKCAAGCLIGDDEYVPEMDDRPSSGWRELVLEGLVPKDHDTLIRRLQEVHDLYNVDGWSKKLELVAKEFGLSYR